MDQQQLAKLQALSQRVEKAAPKKINPAEIPALLAYYYGYSAYEALRNDRMTQDEADTLLQVAQAKRAQEVVDMSNAFGAVMSKKGGSIIKKYANLAKKKVRLQSANDKRR